MPISQTNRAVLYMLAAIGLISVVDTTSKFYTAELHGVVLVWGYFIGITVFVAGNFALRGQFALLRTKRPALQIARPGVLVLSISCLFVSLAYLPIAEATAIGFTGPLFLTALSVPFLGERVGWHRWLAVIVGLAGVMVMVRPGGSVWHWSAGLALSGAIAFAFFQLITRRLSFSEPHQTTLLYTSVGGVAWSSLIVPFFWTPPNPGHWLMFLIIGSMGAAAHFCMIQAFATAQASLLAPFNYSKLIWVTILGYLVFGDFPSVDTLIGSAVIAFAGLYVLYRESRQAAAAVENTEKAGP